MSRNSAWTNGPGGGSGAIPDAPTINSPTFTGPITISANSAGFADGTAGAPSIPFASDADGTGTGFYRGGANQIWAAVNGVAHMRMVSGFGITAMAFSMESSIGSGPDVYIARAAANSVQFGSANSTATARTEINKLVPTIANNVATATFTVTIPNGAHSASLRVRLKGSLGAGGAIGANEASASIAYDVCFARTAGVNAVAAISTAYGSSGSAAVAGAATCTVTGAVSTVSGAVGATNTFTVNVTVARGSGTSDNHTCFAYGELINDNASGVTIA